jgi:hypothetical protein
MYPYTSMFLHLHFMSCIFWDLHLQVYISCCVYFEIYICMACVCIFLKYTYTILCKRKLLCKCKSQCNTFMRILHCPLSLEIMVCKELRVWPLTLFINKCGFLNQEDKTTRKERWWFGGHLVNKSLMKPIVRSFKMAMMLPLKLVQIVNENEWHGGVHLKSYFPQPKWK